MKSLRVISLLLAALMAVMSFEAEDSLAASKTGTITSSKGVIIKLASGETGYACTGKRLKKGTKVLLQPLSAKSRYAKTLAYGKANGWKAAKIAKALKSPKEYKASTDSYVYYKAQKGKKMRYIVAVKKPAPKSAVPAKAKKPKKVASEPVMSRLTVKIRSSEPSYDAPVYDLSGTILSIEGDGKSVAVRAQGEGPQAEASVKLPPGDYELGFPRLSSELASGQSPYWFDTRTVEVGKTDMTVEVVLEPVPGWLLIGLTEDTAAEEPVVTVDGEEVQAPCEQTFPAGNHEIELVKDGQVVRTETIYVCPGAPTGIEL